MFNGANLTYDVAEDSLYILLANEPHADYALSTSEATSPDGRAIELDWDAEGTLIGVRVPSASSRVLPETLRRARRYRAP